MARPNEVGFQAVLNPILEWSKLYRTQLNVTVCSLRSSYVSLTEMLCKHDLKHPFIAEGGAEEFLLVDYFYL